MVGTHLANLANEAALLGARRKHERVQMADFTDSLEKIELGAARKLTLTAADKRRTAYHEAGHALVGMLMPGADPVRKISIIPRTMSLGVTLSAPGSDRFNYDKQGLLAHIGVATGGRADEEIVFSDETTGAESDIDQATQLARKYRRALRDERREIGFSRSCRRTGRRQRRPATRRSPSARANASTTRCAAPSARRTRTQWGCSPRIGIASRGFAAALFRDPGRARSLRGGGLEPPRDEAAAIPECRRRCRARRGMKSPRAVS
jgi:hypothetical protein